MLLNKGLSGNIIQILFWISTLSIEIQTLVLHLCVSSQSENKNMYSSCVQLIYNIWRCNFLCKDYMEYCSNCREDVETNELNA